jgi:hypothetical protein
MSQLTTDKAQLQYPIGSKVMYCNPCTRGHGNVATVLNHLHRTGQERISHIELRFDSGGNHVVTANQIQKYYSKIQ